jgi:hypothetical protein
MSVNIIDNLNNIQQQLFIIILRQVSDPEIIFRLPQFTNEIENYRVVTLSKFNGNGIQFYNAVINMTAVVNMYV